MPGISVFRGITRGFGGPATALLTSSFTMQEIVNAIAEAIRGDGEQPVLNEDYDIYKIIALLSDVNRSPLENPLYKKITKLVFEKKIKIKIDLSEQKLIKSDPYKIVIGDYKVTRGTDE